MGYVFTFGTDHRDPVTRESLGKKYLYVPGDIEQSRRVMQFFYGREWASQYPDRRQAGVERFSLTPASWPYNLAQDHEMECGCIEIVYQYTPQSESEYLLVHCAQHYGNGSSRDW